MTFGSTPPEVNDCLGTSEWRGGGAVFLGFLRIFYLPLRPRADSLFLHVPGVLSNSAGHLPDIYRFLAFLFF